MSSSASSWRRGRTSSAPRWPAISNACRTRCRRSRKPRPKRRSPPRSAGRSPRCLRASVRRSPPPRSRRCIGRRSRRRPEPRAVAVKVLRPGVERRFHADLAAFTFAAQHAENLSAEARRLRLVEVVDTLAALRHGRNGFPAGSGGAFGNGREHQGRSGFPRAGGRLGSHHQGRADAGMDRRDAAVRPRAAASQGLRSAATRPRPDPDLSAPCAARRLLSRRHASGQSVRRR